jgi:hypothetical protein
MEKIGSMGPSLDEIVSTSVRSFHLERMARNNYWIGVDLMDGRKVRIIIEAARADIHAWAEVEP